MAILRALPRNDLSFVLASFYNPVEFIPASSNRLQTQEIGKAFGSFDFAMVEFGQYNKMWPDIHMFPEETVQVGIDLDAKRVMPIHWGAFKLALQSWTDPVERVVKKAGELNVNLMIPEIGEPSFLEHSNSFRNWWKDQL